VRSLDSLASLSGVGGSTGPTVQCVCVCERERERESGERERERDRVCTCVRKVWRKVMWLPQILILYLVVTLKEMNNYTFTELWYIIIIDQYLGTARWHL
jgi:hypothetical protein